MEFEEIIDFLEENKSDKNISGMKMFKINSNKIYGIKMDVLRKLAKKQERTIKQLYNYGNMDIMNQEYLQQQLKKQIKWMKNNQMNG